MRAATPLALSTIRSTYPAQNPIRRKPHVVKMTIENHMCVLVSLTIHIRVNQVEFLLAPICNH